MSVNSTMDVLRSRCRYDVFLSFSGKDTRRTFTDHLYSALVRGGLSTFRDDDEIQRGEVIKLELLRAIQQSRFSIVVFSRNYASSSWRLDELVAIIGECRISSSEHRVLPVYYDVDPSEVGRQSGSFETAFSEYEKQIDEEEDAIEKRKRREKVDEWKKALKEASDGTEKSSQWGTKAIKGFSFFKCSHVVSWDLATVALKSLEKEDVFETEAIVWMCELRILLLSDVKLTGCYKRFLKRLRWLYWYGFHLSNMPNDFLVENLVVLEMPCSHLKQMRMANKV